MARRRASVHYVPVKAASRQQIVPGVDLVGSSPRDGRGRTPAAAPPESPPATRVPGRSWKDPRLLVGLAIVAACVLLGARLLASADDTVPVWSVSADLSAGTPVTADDLQRVDLRFGSPAVAGSYLSATDPLPEGAVLTRDLTTGELLPRSALGAGGEEELVEVPIALPSDAVPATLRAGEHVDVWVTPSEETGRLSRALRVLELVRVVAVPRDASALGPSTSRQVVVGMPAADEGQLATALAQLASGEAVIVRRG